MYLYATLLRARTAQVVYPNTTSITIDDASKLPVLGSGQYFVAELAQGGTSEYIHITAVVGNTLAVARGQETTPTARLFRTNCLCIISIDPYGYELTTTGTSGLTQAQVLARTSIGF